MKNASDVKKYLFSGAFAYYFCTHYLVHFSVCLCIFDVICCIVCPLNSK